MELEKIFDAAKSNPEMKAVFSFKLNEDEKTAFVSYCAEQGLSTGGVMRELLRQFMESANA